MEGGAVGDNDIIAAVGRGVPDRFVFPHEENGDSGSEAAEGRGLEEGAIWGRERANG